ncbi:MAG: hypothetical protein HYZ28_14110 [Myxococcales bacterium]|nr:hypothetical protein [Myxococcales bacterium]
MRLAPALVLAWAAIGCLDLGDAEAPPLGNSSASNDAGQDAGADAGVDAGFSAKPEVLLKALLIDPSVLVVAAGTEVTFKNLDTVDHIVVEGIPGQTRQPLFESPRLAYGDVWKYTFGTAGEFIYFCSTHPVAMRDAKIVVR